MAAPKGTRPPAAGIGRVKGVPNKATVLAREAIARLVDGNAENLQRWLEEIERDEGARAAWACFMDVIEYHIPKLSRAELTGPGGDALTVTVVDPTRASNRTPK
jgi:hypothetical protein